MFGNSKYLSKRYFFLFIFGLIACLLTINSLSAEGTSTETDTNLNNDQKEVIKQNNSTQQGLKIYIDPDTGELISQPEETETIQPNNSVFGDGAEDMHQPKEIIHPDGSATVVMPDNFQHSTKVTIDENGKQTTECKREHEHK